MQIKIFSSESGGEFKHLENDVNKWLKKNQGNICVHSIRHSTCRSGSDSYYRTSTVIIVAYEKSTSAIPVL